MKGIFGRLYQDYLMPGRWEEYRALLQTARQAEYTFLRHMDYARADFTQPASRYFFLRHDIDSDIDLAYKMLAIEQELGIVSTYYFRLSTLSADLMHRVIAGGGEVGYHFEEVAAYAKEHRLHDARAVLDALPAIRRQFAQNFRRVQDIAGAPVRTVASHGDFANRQLGLFNHQLLDADLRAELGITLEAYDAALNAHITFRAADCTYPRRWVPASPMAALRAGSPAVLVLVHPRQWQRAPFTRMKLDLDRLREGVRYGK